jgi:GNAT superfamily N-acetyltransferase
LSFKEISGEELDRACQMVRDVYREFVEHENTEGGNAVFYDFAQAPAMAKRLAGDNFVMVAKSGGEVCGLLEIKNHNHVCLMFVRKDMHKKGIAKKLFSLAAEKCRKKDSSFIDVHASQYAAPVYAKLGFMPDGAKTTVNGITYVPMIFKL